MKKNSLIILVATLMMFSSLTVGLEASVASNNDWFQATPQIVHGITHTGNVTIYANGTVSNSSVVQQVGSTNTYNLLENVNGTLTVERNNTAVNGNNLTINGKQNTAVASANVSGLTFEHMDIVNSSYGIHLTNVQDTVINDVTVNNTASIHMTMVQVYYSDNVTIENSTFILGSTLTDTNGIDAEYGSNLNVSYNSFTGPTNQVCVYASDMSQFVAWGNSIKSTSSINGAAFFLYYGGNSLFENNYINGTSAGITVDYANSVTTINNYLNNTESPFSVSNTISYNSINDTALNSFYQPLVLSDAGNDMVQHANYTNSGSYIQIQSSAATLSDITFNTSKSSYGIQVENCSYFNLYNSKIINTFKTFTNAEVLYFSYMTGRINLVNDNISGTYYGIYLDYSPQFNVTGSQINALYYGIYALQYAISGSRITGNTFQVPYNEEAIYLSADDVLNVNISNNTILSSSSGIGGDGILVYADYVSSNITVENNYILNNNNAVHVYTNNGVGTYLTVSRNIIVNSPAAIYVYDFSNVVVSGNTIINTSDGISVNSKGIDVNVSNNLIENLLGFSGMSFGIDVSNSYGGDNIVSHNTVINVSTSSGYGLEVNYCTPTLVFSNIVLNGGYYGLYLDYCYPLIAFGNSVTNASYGIYSEGNENFSYYSNTITNCNNSFYSYVDSGGMVFANTFLDTQSNNPGLYFIHIASNTGPLSFYHNNFINSATNSITSNIFIPSYPIYMDMPLPVGGNYYSNYTGSGSNGIGSTPMNLSGGIQDLYPLLNKWTSPTVTFMETGLPSGTSWSMKLGSRLQTVSGSSAVFQQTNGQYTTESYSVMNVPGYTASISSGSLNLAGTSNVVTINFTPITYGVTFTESGLSSGTFWAVKIDGFTEATNGTSMTVFIGNGTYNYTIVSVSGYITGTPNGSVTVDGAGSSAKVQFTARDFNLTFAETGLPAGATWVFSVNGLNYTTESQVISVQVANGVYSVNAYGPAGYNVTLATTTVTIDNNFAVVNVTFSQIQSTNTSGNSSGNNIYSLVEGIGIGAAVGVTAAALGTMFVTGTGIFKKKEE